ncbi:Uncharacterized protein Fot_43132 [Forsythia ovata]|uniref:Uncharacterized protein n=1 Tax=Forsythia ovata TaxID=205694 RepID=A0ABD1RN60_9LAMI
MKTHGIEPTNHRQIIELNQPTTAKSATMKSLAKEEQTAFYETPHLRSSNRTGKESETLPWLQKSSFRLRGGDGNNLEEVIYTQRLEKMIVDEPTARQVFTTAFRLVETLATLAVEKEKTVPSSQV